MSEHLHRECVTWNEDLARFQHEPALCREGKPLPRRPARRVASASAALLRRVTTLGASRAAR